MLIRAVLFDLDDTLYPQSAWLAGAWDAVAAEAPHGIPRQRFKAALVAEASRGSDGGHLIDRALATVGSDDVPAAPLVGVFRHHTADVLECFDGAREALSLLHRLVPIGVVTDGDPDVQRGKIASLGLADAFDVVVLSDKLGRERRKPHPAAFLAAASALCVPPSTCVYVGDRPEKDVAGACAARLAGCVRVRTGEYADAPDTPGTLASVTDVVVAIDWIVARLPTPTSLGVHQRAI